MFKVGDKAVLKNSSQNKVMRIQAHNDEFIRAYWSKKEYSFAHESNFRHATEQEIAAGNRIDTNTGVTVITPSGTSKVKGGITAFIDHFVGANNMVDCEILDYPEDYTSPNCKKYDERVR